MDTFAREWTLESALAVLEHPTVDSKLWAEAEWLLVYGLPDIRELLTAASGHATRASFPELKPQGYARTAAPVMTSATWPGRWASARRPAASWPRRRPATASSTGSTTRTPPPCSKTGRTPEMKKGRSLGSA